MKPTSKSLKETASSGGTSSGAVASVPTAGKSMRRRTGVAPNALDDTKTSIFGGPSVKKTKIKEGIAEIAGSADADHEVQMARAELYNTAKYAIELHGILKNVSEAEGLEGWVQSKITKAADYISSVYNHLSAQMMAAQSASVIPVAVTPESRGPDAYKDSLHEKLEEKAKSKAQQKFMGMVHAAQKGEKPASKSVAKVAKDMPKKAAKDYAATKHKGLPAHVKK